MTRSSFPLFQSHIDLAHNYWKNLLSKGDSVIDATCGNGHDSLFLAKTMLDNIYKGQLIAIDIQQQALDACKEKLTKELPESLQRYMTFYNQCHSTFPNEILNHTIKLIVYNLGYLPGGNKNQTTLHTTTRISLENALPLIRPGGAISITCYSGHPAGKTEEEIVLEFAKELSPLEWNCCHHRMLNRNLAPSLILLQKAI